jgi:LysR family transcriptional activator of glutamate synthase operon
MMQETIIADIIYRCAISYKKVHFMTHNQIMFFLAIVEQKNFYRAADNMFISQSSLSRQIKAIENELGVTLFYRNSHQIELTEAGKTFLPFAVKFSKDYSDMVYNLSFLSNTRKAVFTIKIGIIPVLSYSDLTNQLVNLQLNSQQINIDFIEREQSEVLKMLDGNQIDFAIIRTDYLSSDHYAFIPLAIEKIGALCSVKCHLASRKTLDLRDLKNECFVLLNSTSGLYKLYIDAFRNAGFTPKVDYESSRHELLLAMVNNSFNLTLLPKTLVTSKHSRKIKYISLKQQITSTIGLVRKKETPVSQKLNTFQTLIKKHFKMN